MAKDSVLRPLATTPWMRLPSAVPPSPKVLAELFVWIETPPTMVTLAEVGLSVAVPPLPADRSTEAKETAATPEVTFAPAWIL